MIYLTGDLHGNYKRLSKKQRMKWDFSIGPDDYLIVLGDFGLVWSDDKEFRYNCEILSSLPFTILWIQGNHENYDMIETFPTEAWHGGMVRHIVRDKIILLERGQVFEIEGYKFLAFGGASSHDMGENILDPKAENFKQQKAALRKENITYRILGESWWKQELPNEEEIKICNYNCEKHSWRVDYVLTHCCKSRIQHELKEGKYQPDLLTDYFEELDTKIAYKQWYCGHYHVDCSHDEKHTILYQKIVPIGYSFV